MFVAAKEHQTWELVPKGEPVIMTIVAYFRYPASMSKKQRAITQYVTKKPDGDNIVKITSDALNKLAYEDDSQVAHCEVSKLYTEGAEQVVVTLESEVVKP